MESARHWAKSSGGSDFFTVPTTFNFAINSADTGSLRAEAKGSIFYYVTKNIVAWSVTKNGVTVATHTSPVRFSVNKDDVVSVTITRDNNALDAKFSFRSDIDFNTVRTVNLLDYSNIGGSSRYAYVLTNNTIVLCIDTNLLTLANLKTITAVVNNGASLTLTCAGHGFSNGNTISLIDVGGFTADVNHKPFVISNVTTNTFDVTTTVTGAWNTVGYLAGAWITNPIVASITLPNTPNFLFYAMIYRSVDKHLYFFGQSDNPATRIGVVCCVNTDSSSGDWNIAKNWDKSTVNVATTFGASGYYPQFPTNVYDPVNDLAIIGAGIGIIYFPFSGSVPTLVLSPTKITLNSTVNPAVYIYDSSLMILSLGATQKISVNPTLVNFLMESGIQINTGVYSRKYNALFCKNNAGNMKRYDPATFTATLSVTGLGHTWLAVGCAVDSKDKLYMFRSNGAVSYPATYDLCLWNAATNVVTDKEDTYIANWGTGSTSVKKAVYSHFAEKVLATDNATTPNGRIHIFDANRATGKKYIGYVALNGEANDIMVNNLLYL